MVAMRSMGALLLSRNFEHEADVERALVADVVRAHQLLWADVVFFSDRIEGIAFKNSVARELNAGGFTDGNGARCTFEILIWAYANGARCLGKIAT